MPPPVALVTGATRGIGRATAFALGYAGYAVGVCGRDPAMLDTLLQDLGQAGISAAGRAADVADPADAGALVERVVASLGPVDVLVNNAGLGIFKPFAELTLEEWDRTMATNLRSLYVVTREVLPAMRKRGRGAIVNIASLSGRHGLAGGTAYAASKHAVLGFSRSLMLEVRKEGVRVIAICPGSVDTGMMRDQSMMPASDRILQAEDVAATVVSALALPERAMVSELDLRPANP
jgi:NAD(P)-dependent dehydrogenase (short-subunit alcohol dehydrogenase family)